MVEHLVPRLRAGDLVLAFGAGDVTRVSAALLEGLRGRVEAEGEA